MVNFGPLAAEIGSLVWGTPANFNGFRVFAALLHGTPGVILKYAGTMAPMAPILFVVGGAKAEL